MVVSAKEEKRVGKETVPGVPRPSPLFDDLLGELSIQLDSQLCFIMKGYKAESAREKGTWDKIKRKSGISIPESSPSSHIGCAYVLQQ